MIEAPKFSMRFPTWVCALGGAVLIGGSTLIAQLSEFETVGQAVGYLVLPALIGAGIGWFISKMQGVDPKYQKSSLEEDAP